jgi:hypothetical protein
MSTTKTLSGKRRQTRRTPKAEVPEEAEQPATGRDYDEDSPIVRGYCDARCAADTSKWLAKYAGNRRHWEGIAEAIAGDLSSRNGVFLDPKHWSWFEQMHVADGNQHDPVVWNYRDADTLKFMWTRFGFDCALYPQLWRYLFERLPVRLAEWGR